MTIHLVKLSVGTPSVEDQEAWVKSRVSLNKHRGLGAVHDHVTRMHPRREAELLDGGSIYWVIKGVVLCRQEITRIERVTGQDGIARTALLMKPDIIRTAPQMRRAFQGWRYLKPEDAPRDMSDTSNKDVPAHLQQELAELGLL
ncbi:MAG: DUF1489 domain-containing protein [Pseudomonadota bacterium]